MASLKLKAPEPGPILYGSFGPASVLYFNGRNIYGVKNVVNTDGTLEITSDTQNLYINATPWPTQHVIRLEPNTNAFPIILNKNLPDVWAIVPNLFGAMNVAYVTGDSPSGDFPFIHALPNSMYWVEASVALDVGSFPDNYSANPHFAVLDMIADDQSLLNSSAIFWSPASAPSIRCISLSGFIKNPTSSTFNMRLSLATSTSVTSVIPRFVQISQVRDVI